MGKTSLVDHRIEEGLKLVDCLAREGRLDVSAAYWIEDLDDQEWTLSIVSPAFDEPRTEYPYRAINEVLRKHPEIDLDSREIWPKSTDDRKVLEIIDFLRNYPASEAFRMGGAFLKGRWVEASYVYPIKLDDMVVSAGRGDS